MDINKLTKGNAIKYNNRYGTIMAELSYNEYLINHCNNLITVNILDIEPIELGDKEWRNLGFERGGKRSEIETEETSIIWEKELLFKSEENFIDKKVMKIDVFNDELPKLSLEDITGIDRDIPREYTYVHQIQNLLSYITNIMPEYEN